MSGPVHTSRPLLASGLRRILVVRPDSTVERRAVTVGIHDGGRVEVRGALRPGERVVVTGGYGLDTGMRVLGPGAAFSCTMRLAVAAAT